MINRFFYGGGDDDDDAYYTYIIARSFVMFHSKKKYVYINIYQTAIKTAHCLSRPISLSRRPCLKRPFHNRSRGSGAIWVWNTPGFQDILAHI